jgi:hypothetical protein
MYNKKKTEDTMQVQVNESVSQYFALAQNESLDTGSNRTASTSRLENMQLTKQEPKK